ncbi:hypothetical protein [Nocardioides donggukensis]|uniref:PH domain-containing protein n=1 Tax=Nocardioides donggukensis TaxID=2774019 RepID=A0A927K1M4_9ACTN|nr:hypothetical protein [Nocardioides donggukensis]MBD8868677.1 hypothetical protein [Nocardioides donggukensis]
MEQQQPDRLGPTNGRYSGIFGIALVVLLALGSLVDGWQAGDAAILAGLALAALLIWAVVLRPVVLIDGSDLVLRNMFSTTRVALAAVEEVQVKHVLTVLAEGRTLHSTAINRKRVRRTRAAARTGRTGHEPGPVHPSFPDLVESRIRRLAADERQRRGAEGAAVDPTPAVRREWSWPLVAVAVALLVDTAALTLLFA